MCLVDEEFDDTLIAEATIEDLTSLGLKLGSAKKFMNAKEEIKAGKVYVCFKCNNSFQCLENLMGHLKTSHTMGPKEKYKCVRCSSVYSKNSFYNHMKGFFKWHRAENIEDIEVQQSSLYDNLLNVLECENQINNNYLQLKIIKFVCSLLSSGKIPISVYEKLIKELKSLFSVILDNFFNVVQETVIDNGSVSSIKSQIMEINDVFNSVNTKYKLDKTLKELNLLSLPVEIVLDTDLVSRNKGETSKQVYKKCSMFYSPITNTLKRILNDGNLERFYPKTSKKDGVFQHFGDGNYCKRVCGGKNKSKIFINIYYDDIEVTNPLGTKTGTHKLAQFYFSFLDSPSNTGSSPQNMFFLASVKTEDLKLCGSNIVMEPIVKELKVLGDHGLKINGEICYIMLGQIVGDNLWIHTLLGFSEGFTANFPCRRCEMHRENCRVLSKENISILRTKDSFNRAIKANDFPSTGIKFSSILNQLSYFHIVDNVSFDIMHDLLGGVIPDFLRLMLNDFISSGLFTLNQLNYRLESFNYGPHYRNSKPTFFKAGFLKGDTLSNQYSSQVSCLLICLPIIIGDLVLNDNETWELFILLRGIYNLIMTEKITEGQLLELQKDISEYLRRYRVVFNKDLKPKHHHLLHYCSSISAIGPLKQFWSMPYEARHKFFKTVVHSSGNFKNVPKTVSYRYQLSLAYRLLSCDGNIFDDEVQIDECELVNCGDTKYSNLLQRFYNASLTDSLESMNKICVNNNEYKLGTIVALNSSSGYFFGKIIKIFRSKDICFVIRRLSSCYSDHFIAYHIEESNEIECIALQDLAFYLPLFKMITFGKDQNDYISLPCKL